MIIEKWRYKGFEFDFNCEKEADMGIEPVRKAMIKAGAELIAHRFG